jgi:hypothetical protein
MSTFCAIKSKLNGDVIDIRGASKQAGALLDNWPAKSTGNDNQLWEFVPDPSGSGYFFIQSKLNGNVIDILGADMNADTLLDAFPRKTTGQDNQLWGFFPDPASSGYFFIKSALNGDVIDVRGANKTDGALLDAYPQKSTGTENQLWMPVGGTFPPPPKQIPSTLSWSNLGTGSNTTSSGSTECQYTVNLTIQQDGTCHFWGSYGNRGDVPIITAPNQTWQVSIIVLDSNGKGYAFVTGGNAPSAPQAGWNPTWDKTQTIPAITQNWNAIAARHTVVYGYQNDVSFLAWVESFFNWIVPLVEDVGTAVEDVATVLSFVS